MANKINNKTKQNEFFKKKLKTIIITYSIFAIIVFILALLKKYSIINANFSLILFYIIMAIITFIIIIVLCNQMEKNQRKKETAISILINFIGIVLLITLGISIDVRKEIIDFSKNATKTDALIIDIDKDVQFVRDNCGSNGRRHGNRCKSNTSDLEWGAEDYYQVYFTYNIQYMVENQTYISKYRSNESKPKFEYKEQATNCKPKYKKGDYITIYYDNDNPENIKGNFSLGFGMVYAIESITIAFQCFYFIKHKKLMKELAK